MKKLSRILALASILTFFSSCEKEDFNDNQQDIQKDYQNDLLESRVVTYDSDYYTTELYFYDSGKKVSKIEYRQTTTTTIQWLEFIRNGYDDNLIVNFSEKEFLSGKKLDMVWNLKVENGLLKNINVYAGDGVRLRERINFFYDSNSKLVKIDDGYEEMTHQPWYPSPYVKVKYTNIIPSCNILFLENWFGLLKNSIDNHLPLEINYKQSDGSNRNTIFYSYEMDGNRVLKSIAEEHDYDNPDKEVIIRTVVTTYSYK